ncbi:MAG: nitrate/nitrite transporter [Acetobacteraceae bacterium]
MLSSYVPFIRANAGALSFGVLLMLMSSFGQTFFISLFGADLRATYGLSDGDLGSAYAVATFASAFTLQRVGRWLDRTSVRRYTIGVAAVLASACALMALGINLPMLVGAFYLLRLGGQGLMVHTAQTVTARAFPRDRGKALSIANLGMAVGEALLPATIAVSMLAVGWRNLWGICAVLVVLGCVVALQRVPSGVDPVDTARTVPSAPRRFGGLWLDPRVALTLPVMLASSFIITGFFFHQTRLLEQKSWAFEWWASCFVGYAVTRAASVVLIGPVIDRFGAVRILPFYNLPLALSMAAVAFTDAPWSAPVFLVLMGLSAGMSATLLTALWMELFGSARLGEVRATVASASVIASGTSPTIMGYGIDWGIALSTQAMGLLVFVVLASAVATRVRAYARPA